MVRDWNDMERIWQYVYSKDQLQTFSEEVWRLPLPPAPHSPGSAPSCASLLASSHISPLHFWRACCLSVRVWVRMHAPWLLGRIFQREPGLRKSNCQQIKGWCPQEG